MRSTLLLALLVFGSHPSRAESGFYLKDGDTVVFYGDSITNQRLYSVFIETFTATRFPGRRIRFVHSGWPGDRAGGGAGGSADIRLERDVIAYNPSVVTIMFGMNDGGYRPYSPELFDDFTAGYEHIVRKLRSALRDVRISALAPSPYDDVTRPPEFEGGYNDVLVRYGQFVRQLASRENLAFADLNTPVVDALEIANKKDPDLARRLIPDRVHPSEGVHLLMAESLLKAWRAPALISSVELDASTARITHVENTEISGLDASHGISWTQKDAALPMPVDMSEETLAAVVDWSDFTASLNQQQLEVTGLAAGRYALRIDGEFIGAFKARELARGINLAMLKTPMQKQAEAVYGLVLRHNHIHFARWRMLEEGFHGYAMTTVDAAMQALDAVEEEAIAKQWELAQPHSHRYQIARQ
jgi:lysophospholipase L1-like esterase